MRLAMGFPLQADEAYRIGLAQWLVPHEALMEKALEVATHIAAAGRNARECVRDLSSFPTQSLVSYI